MVSTFRSRAGWLIVCCTASVGSPAGRSLSRSGEDGLSMPTGWFAVASHGMSDMLTTSGVTELLTRAKGEGLGTSLMYVYYRGA